MEKKFMGSLVFPGIGKGDIPFRLRNISKKKAPVFTGALHEFEFRILS